MAGFPNVLSPGLFTSNPPTGIPAIDAASIQAAANTSVGNGVAVLQPGTYSVSSSLRIDTASFNVGTGQWTDASITSADIGSYVLGPGLNIRVPQIISVPAASTFVTDFNTSGSLASGTYWIVKPAFVLPEGCWLRGRGMSYGQNYMSSSTTPAGTRIVDTGNGITWIARGSTAFGGTYNLEHISFFGGVGGARTAFAGGFIGNQGFEFQQNKVDYQYYLQAGCMADENYNSINNISTVFANCGNPVATNPTGGFIAPIFTYTASAALKFDNCFFFANTGNGIAGNQPADGIGLNGTTVINTQFAGLANSSWGTFGGYHAVLGAGGSYANIIGCWFETAPSGGGDIYANSGPVEVIGSEIYSTTTAPLATGLGPGFLNLRGCSFQKSSGTLCANGGNIAWDACSSPGASLYTGGPTAAQMLGRGTSLQFVSGTGVSPGAFGTMAAGSNIWQGSGVPSNSSGANGDIYVRTDTPGTANQRLYMKSAGAWVALTI